MVSENVNLTDYIHARAYNKDETYTNTMVDYLISQIKAEGINIFKVVTMLPEDDIDPNRLYLVYNTLVDNEGNRFDIYLYYNGEWERIDGFDFDIDNYPTLDQLAMGLNVKANQDEVDTLSDAMLTIQEDIVEIDAHLEETIQLLDIILNEIINKIISELTHKSDNTHRHENSTTDSDGFMSKTDKSKLNSIAEGANKTVVDSSLSSTSTNPVQNKVVKSALDGKSDTTHKHTTGDVSDTSAYNNIGSSANATQKTINNNINTKLGEKANSNNVYSKTETYTQSEITTLISNAVSGLDLFEVVTSLPTSNIKDNKLYLVVNSTSIDNNSYDIYFRFNNNWERLDALEFDISNFYDKSEIDTLLNGKVDTNDSRLTNARTPTSHTHGIITNTGNIGTAANKPIITTTNGLVTTGSFGTTANTFCQGNDSRLSDARTPTSHAHGSLSNTGVLDSDISSVNKIAVTDSNGYLKTIASLPYSKLSGTPTIPSKVSQLTNDSGFLTSHQDITGKEDKSNKVTTLDNSTTHYPTTSLLWNVYNMFESLIEVTITKNDDTLIIDSNVKGLIFEGVFRDENSTQPYVGRETITDLHWVVYLARTLIKGTVYSPTGHILKEQSWS